MTITTLVPVKLKILLSVTIMMSSTPSTMSILTTTIPISDSLTPNSTAPIASSTTTYSLSRFESDIVSSTMAYVPSTTMSFTASASATVPSTLSRKNSILWLPTNSN